jgi:hypothetical protein
VLFDYKKIPLAFHFLISVCYMAVGVLLLTGLFHVIDRGISILFGVIVIGYGIFRLYKAFAK